MSAEVTDQPGPDARAKAAIRFWNLEVPRDQIVDLPRSFTPR